MQSKKLKHRQAYDITGYVEQFVYGSNTIPNSSEKIDDHKNKNDPRAIGPDKSSRAGDILCLVIIPRIPI